MAARFSPTDTGKTLHEYGYNERPMRRTCGRFDGSPSFETRTPCYYVNDTDRFYGSRSHNVFGPLKYVHFTVCVAASTAYGPSLDVHRRPSRLEPVKLAITIRPLQVTLLFLVLDFSKDHAGGRYISITATNTERWSFVVKMLIKMFAHALYMRYVNY